MKFNISEIFLSVQGEGPHTGRPAVFVRFSGCNLRCRWGANLCDTAYTSWFPETNLLSLPEVIEQTLAAAGAVRYAVITGGEPAIAPGLGSLCRELKRSNFEIAMETNGTAPLPAAADYIVCSPKLSDAIPVGSEHEERHRRAMELHPSIKGSDPRIFLKFVIGAETGIEEILAIVRSTRMPSKRVYLMPEGVTKKEIEDKAMRVQELAEQAGFLTTTRLHIVKWGNRRGV